MPPPMQIASTRRPRQSASGAQEFRGAIRYKSKQEMLDIAASLSLPNASESETRAVLEERITSYLQAHADALRSNPLYAGLYGSLDRDARRDAESSNGDSDEGASTAPNSTGKRGPRKSAGGAAATAAAAAAANANASAHRAAHAAEAGSAAIGSAAKEAAKDAAHAVSAGAGEAADAVSRASASARASLGDVSSAAASQAERAASEGSALARRARRLTAPYARRLRREAAKARAYLSNTRRLTGALLVLELVLLVTRITPTYALSIGSKGQFASVRAHLAGKHLTARLPFVSISVPSPAILLDARGFWAPLLAWAGWTFALPLLVSHVISFDKGATSSAQANAGQPSLFTFTFVRLLLLAYLTLAAPRTPASRGVGALGLGGAEPVLGTGGAILGRAALSGRRFYSYDYAADVLPAAQSLLAAAAAAGFTTYEAMVHGRNRA